MKTTRILAVALSTALLFGGTAANAAPAGTSTAAVADECDEELNDEDIEELDDDVFTDCDEEGDEDGEGDGYEDEDGDDDSEGVEDPEAFLSADLSDSKVAYGAKDRTTVEYFLEGDDEDNTPTGTVTLYVNGKTTSSQRVKSDGEGTFTLSNKLPVGKHTVTLKYSGDKTYEPVDDEDGPHRLTVTQAKTKAAIAVKSSFKKNARPTVKVTVAAKDASVKPAGKVTVFVGKKKVATTKLKSNGKVNVKLPKLKVKGKQTIKVVYAGDKNQAASTVTKNVTIK